MPITRHVDNIHFDPGLPPGNPLLDENTQAFPTIFRLASQTFDFGSQAFGRRGRYFFDRQMMQHHGTALGAWNRLLSNLMPTDHMVELSSIETTLDQIASNTLHDAVTFREVNTAYREARIPSYNLLTEQQSAAVANMAHESINTAQALNMITRSARTPDFTAMAPSWSVGPEPQHAFELLLVGELKQRFDLLVMTLKIRGLLVGTLCQGLRYLAYSKRIYDTRFALIIHGHDFRRCFVTEDDVLWIDIGRLGPDEENDVIDMTLSHLLTYGLDHGADPTALYHELGPDSTFTDGGAGHALSSFSELVGQTWINNHLGIKLPLELGGDGHNKYARVQNFTLESLARAASDVRLYMEGQQEDGQRGPDAGWEEENVDVDTEGHEPKKAHHDMLNDPEHITYGREAQTEVDSIPPSIEADSTAKAMSNDDLMRDQLMKIVDQKNESLSSLHCEKTSQHSEEKKPSPYTPEQIAFLRAIGKEMRDAGVSLDEIYPG